MPFYRRAFKAMPPMPQPPSGEVLMTISQAELDEHLDASADDTAIKHCTYAASYSWVDAGPAKILIPGKPPAWTPLEGTPALKPDKGSYFRDPNAARWPSYPTEPAVRAVLIQNETSAKLRYDVFGCGSTMGNLLRFARKTDRAFKFDVQLVGQTVFLSRTENAPTEVLQDVRGHGHSFPEAYTTCEEDVEGSVSHQRIISYDFGGLKLAVRFESDGYFNNDNASTSASVKDSVRLSSGELRIAQAGHIVPQSSIFDIKTRWIHNPIKMEEIYPTLWLKQIPNFILAYNTGGRFHNIDCRDVGSEVQEWEVSHEHELKRFASLLKKIVSFVKDAGEDLRMVVYRPPKVERDFDEEGEDELHIMLAKEGGGPDVLPESLKAMWKDKTVGTEHTGSSVSENVAGRAPEDGQDLSAVSSDGGEVLYPEADKQAESDPDSEPDYTACSETCGYCGRCKY